MTDAELAAIEARWQRWTIPDEARQDTLALLAEVRRLQEYEWMYKELRH